MQKIALLLFFSIAFNSAHAAPDAAKGKVIFESTCTACHKIGGKLIGPDLAGVKGRWNGDMKKLTEYIHNPGKFFTTDAYVKKLVDAAGGTLMSGQPQLSDADVADIIDYVNAPTAGGPTKGPGGGGEAYMPVPQDNGLMRLLFIGAI